MEKEIKENHETEEDQSEEITEQLDQIELNSSTPVLDYLESQVQILYSFGKSVSRNCAEGLTDDYECLMKMIDDTTELLKKNEEPAIAENKAQYYYLLGKTMSVRFELDDECIAMLSKAVKTDPKNLDAWDLLGECFVRMKKLADATLCYYNSMKFGKSKQILRKLSTIMRETSLLTTENVKNRLTLSIEYALQSKEMDVADGQSWAVLGSAYLSLFCVEQEVKTLSDCIKAYDKALKDPRCTKYADIYYNRGIALKYAHMYTDALVNIEKSIVLDPSWVTPKNTLEDLIKYVMSVETLFQRKGQVKLKKLHQMAQSLDTSSLGLYNKPVQTLIGRLVLELVPLSKLQSGENDNKIICGRVVCVVYHQEPNPYTFCIVDKELTCHVVSVYNLNTSKGPIIGDSVAIPEPYFVQIYVKYKDQRFQYPLIKVAHPLSLVVNKKCLGIECISSKLDR